MAEKSKLKWLRKEFGSSEELEYYLSQLKHQDKLKSDIISLLERFQHLLFASYEPDFLTITYNGQWDVGFGPVVSDPVVTPITNPTVAPTTPTKRKIKSTSPVVITPKRNSLARNAVGSSSNTNATNSSKKMISRAKLSKPAATAAATAKPANSKSTNAKPTVTNNPKPVATKPTATKSAPVQSSERATRIDLKALLQAGLLSVGARLKHKTQPTIVAIVTSEGRLKIGKHEYHSLSSAATSFASSGRRDGWHCWLFQDNDGEWKTIDLLRERWRNGEAHSG